MESFRKRREVASRRCFPSTERKPLRHKSGLRRPNHKRVVEAVVAVQVAAVARVEAALVVAGHEVAEGRRPIRPSRSVVVAAHLLQHRPDEASNAV